MKKLMAALLTGCLALQSCIGFAVPVQGAVLPVRAVDVRDTVGDASKQSQKTAADIGRAGSRTTDEDTKTESALEIEVHSSLLFPYEDKVSIEISNGSNMTQTKELDFTESSSSLARFDVPEGEYTVTVLADKFARYQQTVTAGAGWVHKILVCPTKMETGSNAKPGWIRPGDVNGDNMIDEKDTKALLSAIRKNPEDSSVDLNKDGKADLADLQNLVQSIDETQESQVEKLGIPQDVQPMNGTILEGNAEELLNYEKGVILKPSNDTDAISENNAVGLEFTLAEDNATSIPEIGGMTIQAPAQADADGNISSEIADGTIVVVYVDENGQDQTKEFSLAVENQTKISGVRKRNVMAARRSKAASHVSVDADGSLILDFGGQIAVKKVTIRITGIKKTEPFVTIARVEFVNNMEERIPAPQLDIPVLAAPIAGNEELTVSWNAQNNITGYEVYVSGPVKKQDTMETQIIRVSDTQHRITAINDKPLVNFKEYTIKVRSVNGDWKSPWSEEETGIPAPQSKPAPPDYVTAEGGYRSIQVSWKDMDDANGYMVYYKKAGDHQFQPVVEGFEAVKEGTGKLETNFYTITGLEENVSYSIYVRSWNELGWGEPSLTSIGTTRDTAPPELPNYKLLNTSNGEGKVTSHIVNAVMGGSNASMVESPLDTQTNSALGLVDDNYSSYWRKADWDDGVSYPSPTKGMTITLDDDYAMNYFTFAAADQKAGVSLVRIEYWNSANPDSAQTVSARLIGKTDNNNNPFYIVKLDKTITASKIHMCLGRTWADYTEMKVGEIHFHRYDSLEDDIMGLYMDSMHTTLRADVTSATIQALEDRLEMADEESGEKHPLYGELKLELKTAREILESNLSPSYEVDNRITAKKDTHLGFSGLNAWQPLGKVAYTGESLLVYVGHNTKRTGDSADLQFVMTQQHAEAKTLAKTVNLKVGRNEITVPQIADKDFERGGQLYIAYTGNNSSDQYAVRISGGSDIPVLNIYGKTGTDRTEAIRTYIQQLENYVTTIQETHEKIHTGTKNVDYPYDRKNCILNATDIMMEDMMYSLPATQILAGIGTAEDKVTKLDTALKAMESTMTLFYQHKGLSNDAGTTRGNNALPSRHLNIRYMRMFAGAFMYASGNHIGVEWDSATLASSVNDCSGFGWGIAHEIGHNINQGTYAIAEITNNYFAQLLTKQPGKTRFEYSNVYEKVTSGTVGRSSNQATQLALYWQLHLAFDDKDDRHMFDQYEDQFNNLFFARVDTYSRNPGKAPQAGLELGSNVDQNLMRLACAAANKNILPFFERWGMVPDETTTAYAAKYGEADTKARYYVNDDARDYRAAHPNETGTIENQDAVTATAEAKSNQVEITIHTDKDADVILGYEIIRSVISNGVKESQVVGFQPVDTAESTVFTDTISALNNRVISYEVRAVDKFLNYSNAASAGSVKIQTDGVLNKALWTVETTMASNDDTVISPDNDDPDSGYHETDSADVQEKRVHSIDRILDNDKTAAGTYHGISDGTAVITIDMHRTEKITSLKYLGSALESVTLEISKDGGTWITVKADDTSLKESGEGIIWFDSVKEEAREEWIGTYDARYVRLTTSQSGNISIQEMDVCGPSGDNLEFLATENNQPAIGKLTADYQYGSRPEDVIPAGSLIFTGSYKGNPAYNLVVLYDTEGNVIGSKDGNVYAEQVILADVPAQGNLGETSNGTWVYYVLPEYWDENSLKDISGVRGELYRVDDAITLEGERIVSDTQMITILDPLPEITLTGNGSD